MNGRSLLQVTIKFGILLTQIGGPNGRVKTSCQPALLNRGFLRCKRSNQAKPLQTQCAQHGATNCKWLHQRASAAQRGKGARTEQNGGDSAIGFLLVEGLLEAG